MEDEIQKLINEEAEKRYPKLPEKKILELSTNEIKSLLKETFKESATFLMSHLESRGWVSGEEMKEMQYETETWQANARSLQSQLSEKEKQITELKEDVNHWRELVIEYRNQQP